MGTPEEIFWDHFAQEYTEIQEESQVTIAEDLVAYLRGRHLLPVEMIVDFAAGSGKYIPAFYPFVQQYLAIDFSQQMLTILRENVPDPQAKIILTKKDQQLFLADRKEYPCIFMAMNPALNDRESFMAFYQKTKCLLILRVVEESEDLFQPLEKRTEKDPALQLMKTYQNWLDQASIAWESQRFSYMFTEDIEQEIFWAYFSDDYSPDELSRICQKLFNQEQKTQSTTKIVFELLIIQKESAN